MQNLFKHLVFPENKEYHKTNITTLILKHQSKIYREKKKQEMCLVGYSHKKNNSSVGHCKSQTQNSTAHDCITEVEDGHAKGSLSLKLQKEEHKGCCLAQNKIQ